MSSLCQIFGRTKEICSGFCEEPCSRKQAVLLPAVRLRPTAKAQSAGRAECAACARNSVRTRRGSAMVVAVFLLALVTLLGAVLCTWGLLNVQTTVIERASSQAYFTAKSIADATVEAIAATQIVPNDAVDMALRAIAPGAPYTVQADANGLPAQNGTVELTYTCEGENFPASLDNGTQIITVTAAATVDSTVDVALQEGSAYTRRVARQVSIKRTTGGAQGVLVMGAGGAAGSEDFSLANGVQVRGNVLAVTGGTVTLGNAAMEAGDLFVRGGNIVIDGALQMHKKSLAVFVAQNGFTLQAAGQQFGKVYVKAGQYTLPLREAAEKGKMFPAGIYGDKSARQNNTSPYGGNPAIYWNSAFEDRVNVQEVWDAVVPSYAYTLLEHTPAEPEKDPDTEKPPEETPEEGKEDGTGAEGKQQPGETETEDKPIVTVSESVTLKKLPTEELQLDPNGGVLNVDLDTALEATPPRIVFLTPGTVNLYVSAESFTLAQSTQITRVDGAVLNLISASGSLTLEGGPEVRELNLLAPTGVLTLASGAQVHGTVWGKSIQCESGVSLDGTAPASGAWWGDISGAAELSGEVTGTVAAMAGPYVDLRAQ